MTWKQVFAFLGLLIVFCFLAAWAIAAEQDPVRRGAYLYNTSKPACSTCHNPRQNSLDSYGKRGSIKEAKEWLRRPNRQFEKAGKKGLMPAYKMPDRDLEALAEYLMTLKK